MLIWIIDNCCAGDVVGLVKALGVEVDGVDYIGYYEFGVVGVIVMAIACADSLNESVASVLLVVLVEGFSYTIGVDEDTLPWFEGDA